MKVSQKIALEMSTKREALNALLSVDELSDEQRTEMGALTTRMQELETEARAAIMAEDVPVITHTTVADGEDRELRSLIDRANVGEIFEAALEHRATTGPEAEVQAHFRLAANAVPLALLETRAVTPAPGQVAQNQAAIGTEGLFTGTKLANHNVSAATSYANYRSELAYGRVDGTFAGSVGDLKIVMGAASYGHAAGAFRSANAGDRAALEDLMQVTGGVKVSAHVPAVASNKQNAVIRLGSRRDMVAPIWEGVTLIPDEITKAANGQIVITAVMLHAVKILRAEGFYKQQTQHA